jgi:hypothetical protein
MADVGHLPIPSYHRTIEAALGTARRLALRGDLRNVVVLANCVDDSTLFLSAGDGEEITRAEAFYLIECGKHLLLHPERHNVAYD